MSALDEINEADKKRFEAGMIEFVRLQNDVKYLTEEKNKLAAENHLLQLERAKLNHDLLEAREHRDIALNDRDEAVSHRVAYETLHAMTLRHLQEFTPPTKPARTLTVATANEIGSDAVAKAIEDKSK